MEQTTEQTAVEYDPSSIDSVNDAINSNTHDIDAMSDEEFEQHFDGESNEEQTKEAKPAEEAKETETEEPVDLDALYSAQIEDKESKLDKPLYIKINGTTHPIDNVNEMRELMEKGLNYTKKMQELSAQRKALESNSNRVDEESTVTPEASRVNEIATEILNSSHAEAFKNVSSKLPDDVRTEMSSNPQLLQGFYGDVQSGLAQKIMPQVERLMSVNGMSFNQAYFEAGKATMEQSTKVETKRNTLKSQPKQSINVGSSTVDVDSMSDEAFAKYFDNL